MRARPTHGAGSYRMKTRLSSTRLKRSASKGGAVTEVEHVSNDYSEEVWLVTSARRCACDYQRRGQSGEAMGCCRGVDGRATGGVCGKPWRLSGACGHASVRGHGSVMEAYPLQVQAALRSGWFTEAHGEVV